ncbi:cytochrome P450 [Abortiporus biennis]|nr:cytochrome P450 [Abortiporus biennis]
MTTSIPSPPSIPFLGHITSVEREVPLRSLGLLARQYGEIYELTIVGQTQLVISSYELLNEVSNEKRFCKTISPALMEVRNAASDGLFTAHAPGEENWYIAHRILMPAFSAMNVRNMFDDMYDIASQLLLKWERFGPGYAIDPAADFTRLTFDAISLCAMNHRLNSFYSNEPHPFVVAMGDFLLESGNRANQPGIITAIKRGALSKYEQDQNTMLDLVDEIIKDRKEHPIEKNDLLNTMLYGKDKETGKGMTDDNIKRNLLTFLIAGHETTSGALSFAVYYLLKNPESMRKLRDEIDEKIGDRPMNVNDVNKLPYLLAVIRETLRLAPTAPIRATSAIENTTVLNGKYAIPKGTTIICSIFMTQKDPKIWGEDAEKFKPERMLDGKFEALPPNAWQPFGFGMRGCIGRPFAWQEAQLVLVAVLQRFDLVMEDPSYSLQIKQTLTIKPTNFKIHAVPRAGKPKLLAIPSSSLLNNTHEEVKFKPASDPQGDNTQHIYVLYGSNTGSSEAFAQRIASDAASHGFSATIGTMDSATEHVPTDGPVIIVTASFEGEPADNAAHFVSWLSGLKGDELKDVTYGIFGCGNHDWVTTYQKIPKLCDSLLSEHGAKRLVDRGEGDAGGSDFFEAFDIWEATLFEALHEEFGTKHQEGASSGFLVETVETGESRAKTLRQNDADFGTVIENKLLTSPNAPQKRHIAFKLPEGSSFQAGDYLAILPSNPARDVHRALAYFGFHSGQEIVIKSSGPSSLPVNKAIPFNTLLTEYVELAQPATTRDLRMLLEAAKSSEPTTKALNKLLESYAENVVTKRLSVLDILEDNPSIKISVATFLQMLPSMRIRQYSISSSPLNDPQHATLTVSVIEAPAISGRNEPFLGVASNYLANLRPGDKVQMAVRSSNTAFHPPSDPTVPMIMFCAGAGLAPMRGFLQERAMQKKAGRKVAKNLLFFGCRDPQEDYLYSESDLKEWIDLGIVDARPAFSRAIDQSAGCNRVWHDREDVAQIFLQDAKLYLCGAGKILSAIKDKLVDIIAEKKGLDKKAATLAFTEVVSGRFATDVFE